MRLTRSQISIIPILIVLDVLAIVIALLVSYQVRFFSVASQIFPVTKGLPPWSFYRYSLLFIVPLWTFIFFKSGFYRMYFVPILDELIRIIQAVSLGIIFLILTTFFYRDFSYSRLTFILFWLFSVLFIFGFREVFKLIAGSILRSLVKNENILVVGKDNRMVKAILKKLPNYRVSFFPYENESDIGRLKQVIVEKDIHQVLCVHANWPSSKLLELYDWCENYRIDLKLLPDIVQMCKGELCIDSSLGVPIYHLRPVSLNGYNFYFKRAVDLIISITILSFIWPLLLLVTILIKIDSKGPFLYYHKRMGYRGRVFSFYKFRTMVQNADDLLEKFKKLSERKGPVFKMANDPRVTKLGKFLRRYSIDEVPQLLNVLKGEMSLVGPRPQVLWEASAYDDWAKRRLRTLPGITGLWQISGRASLSYEEMIELDIYYIENWSPGLDLKILFKTLPAIFSKKGAC